MTDEGFSLGFCFGVAYALSVLYDQRQIPDDMLSRALGAYREHGAEDGADHEDAMREALEAALLP